MNRARINSVKKIKAGRWDSALWATLDIVSEDLSEEMIDKLRPGKYGEKKN